MTNDALKREAARQAAAMVTDGMAVGLGTGSTAAFFIDCLIEKAKAGLAIVCIPTSERSAAQARDGGLVLVDFDTHPTLDLTVDGADEISRTGLNLIKGLGGALLREKIVAAASRRLVIIADDSKLVDTLGVRTVVPVEVTRFGWHATAAHLRGAGAALTQRLAADGAPYITDGGNFILDAKFPSIPDPAALSARLIAIPGVVETGLFVSMAEQAIIATPTGVITLPP
jgi:ribose 5-phosphate isomerase A